jgi:hypothetical protein
MTATAHHWTEAAAVLGFEDGWGACADQLKLLCEGGVLG